MEEFLRVSFVIPRCTGPENVPTGMSLQYV